MKMTVVQALTLVICLAMVSTVSPYPVGRPQTAENKGRGRSYPLIISHYSNVRNSKYNSPAATEAPAAAAEESDDPVEKDEDDDIYQPSPSASNADDSKKDQEEEEKADESLKEIEADEKNDAEKSELAQPPDMVNADWAPVSKNESISVVPVGEPVAVDEPHLVSKLQTDVPVGPSDEKTEVIEKNKGSKLTAIKETDSTGATLSNFNEEVPTETTSLNEADQPAALGESGMTVEQVKSTLGMDSTVDSVAKSEEPATGEQVVLAMSVDQSNDEVKTSDESAKVVNEPTTEQVKVAPIIPSDEVAAPESTVVESARTASLATEKEKTSEFFEDRSFKDRPEPELILEAIRQGAAAFGAGEEPKTLPSPIDDVANEGIRLQRDDNKKATDKKEKEKEKYLAKPTKEKKPVKPIQSNDPVQEYDDIVRRAGKSKDDSESTTDTIDVVDKALISEESISLSLVPSNYPVVLATGESTFNDRITPANAESPKDVTETAEDSSTISSTSSHHPVALPSGESTLSDTITQEETKSSASGEPIIVSVVPSNYPVILPSGVSTLSDKVKPEDWESPEAEKTVEK